MLYYCKVVNRQDVERLLIGLIHGQGPDSYCAKNGFSPLSYFAKCDDQHPESLYLACYTHGCDAGSEPVGVMRIEIHPHLPAWHSTKDRKPVGLIDEVYVHPAFRGKGALLALCHGMRALLNAKDCWAIYSNVKDKRLRLLFERWGMTRMFLQWGALSRIALPRQKDGRDST